MDKNKILAFVTVHGSTNSHTAILARMMNIPALIGVKMDLESSSDGMTAVVDGFQGGYILTRMKMRKDILKARSRKKLKKQKRLLQELKGQRKHYSGWKEDQYVCKHW